MLSNTQVESANRNAYAILRQVESVDTPELNCIKGEVINVCSFITTVRAQHYECKAAQKENNESEPSASNNISSDAILAFAKDFRAKYQRGAIHANEIELYARDWLKQHTT